MTRRTIQNAFIKVLQEIQHASGVTDIEITGSTCPLHDIEGFDSLLCLDAIGMLAEELDFDIPDNNNIFVEPDSGRQLTIDESVEIICSLMETQS